jgi:hypothetical protein
MSNQLSRRRSTGKEKKQVETHQAAADDAQQ